MCVLVKTALIVHTWREDGKGRGSEGGSLWFSEVVERGQRLLKNPGKQAMAQMSVSRDNGEKKRICKKYKEKHR